MNQTEQQKSLAKVLGELEETMRGLSLWGAVSPTNENLSSVEPFSYDTLELQEWLQWIMIPRFRALLESSKALPVESNISEYAEVKFAGPEYAPLLADIRNVDAVINNA